ncbi:MAG: MBL fold metallo-hydrolase [Planctomycetota bacterium]|jgi:phosphoribosyl 1,2-cyclic phosphodiesterase|nr:MBL fold metallo-hydrolase [Planctomycetota bacterium]
MHVQVLSSGSKGNSTLVRAGETALLVDSGLSGKEMRARLSTAGMGPRSLDHLLITHAHLDHSRSASSIARSHDATVHCALANMEHRSLSRAPRYHTLDVGGEHRFEAEAGEDPEQALRYASVPLPHDCDPTVAYRLEHRGRVLCVVTDLGIVRDDVVRALQGAHVLVLEFNYDPHMLDTGPYPAALRRRVSGNRGHLSNQQAAEMLVQLAGPNLHTLVLAHLSAKNNTPELALEAAHGALRKAGREGVEVIVASQHVIGDNLEV